MIIAKSLLEEEISIDNVWSPAQLIMARRTSLHPKAEYICADLSCRPNFPLQSRGGAYIIPVLITQAG